jgi:hypothetical protein
MGSRRPKEEQDETINPRRRFRRSAPDGAIRTVTGLRLSEKKRNAQSSSGNLVEASDRISKGPGIKGGETRIRPAKPTTNPRRFHAQFILEHPENPSKAARASLPLINPSHTRGSNCVCHDSRPFQSPWISIDPVQEPPSRRAEGESGVGETCRRNPAGFRETGARLELAG